jgi:two-component system chemotaxis response regulator CheB
MGSDGASGMAAIHAAGGETMAQDSSTSVIFGMPQRAIERRAVTFIGTPEQIVRRLKGTGLALASSKSRSTPQTHSIGTAES